jgi:hypothetical protein
VGPDVVDAARGQSDDRIEGLEAADEVGFGGGHFVLALPLAIGCPQRV